MPVRAYLPCARMTSHDLVEVLVQHPLGFEILGIVSPNLCIRLAFRHENDDVIGGIDSVSSIVDCDNFMCNGRVDLLLQDWHCGRKSRGFAENSIQIFQVLNVADLD